MDTTKDYYAILGLMPDAEDVVITAAYRVLISRYHPDKWKGDPAVAHQKSVELNEAYAVLSDTEKRRQYDTARASKSATFDEFQEDDDVDDALSELEARWQVAVDVFPDLADLRKRLAKTAHRLAFAFVIHILVAKQFANRMEIANKMEEVFLKRYFGSKSEIIYFARQLINLGHKDAVRELNKLVDVLGDQIDSKLIIDRVEKKFSLRSKLRTVFMHSENQVLVNKLQKALEASPNFYNAIQLARMLGFHVEVPKVGFFEAQRYKVFNDDTLIFSSEGQENFTQWACKNLL